MKKIFITGDRSMDPVQAVGAVDAILKDIIAQDGTDIAIATGNLAKGVERAVRYLMPEAAMNIFPYEETPEGYVDFEELYSELAKETDQIIFLHEHPSSSRIGKALFATVPSEKISLPWQEAMAELI